MYQWEISLIGRANTLHVFGSCSIQLFPSPVHRLPGRGPHRPRRPPGGKGSMLRGIAI